MPFACASCSGFLIASWSSWQAQTCTNTTRTWPSQGYQDSSTSVAVEIGVLIQFPVWIILDNGFNHISIIYFSTTHFPAPLPPASWWPSPSGKRTLKTLWREWKFVVQAQQMKLSVTFIPQFALRFEHVSAMRISITMHGGTEMATTSPCRDGNWFIWEITVLDSWTLLPWHPLKFSCLIFGFQEFTSWRANTNQDSRSISLESKLLDFKMFPGGPER